MGLFNASTFSLFCNCFMILAIIGHAQDSPSDYINAHNAARSEVNVAPLAWNESLASYAQNYANERKSDCNIVHSHGPYGENLAMAWGSWVLTGIDAVKMWVDEKPYYDYYSNSCVGGQQCLHYTQVVWHSTTTVGCAKVTCDYNGGVFISCNYYPPGNYIGERPY